MTRLSSEAHETRLQVTVDTPREFPALPAAVEVAAYRIVQEAVTNVIRHAHARLCCIRLVVEDALQIEVRDDGTGLEEAERSGTGMGLTSMRERAEELGGTFIMSRATPEGTRIIARLPLVDRTRARVERE